MRCATLSVGSHRTRGATSGLTERRAQWRPGCLRNGRAAPPTYHPRKSRTTPEGHPALTHPTGPVLRAGEFLDADAAHQKPHIHPLRQHRVELVILGVPRIQPRDHVALMR